MLDHIPLQLDREGIKERADGETGGWVAAIIRGGVIILNISVKGGRLFKGGDKTRDAYYSRKYGTLM